MKNKFSIFNYKPFSYLKQLIKNENPDNKSETIKRKVAVENNLRWQDDGGPAVDTRPLNQLDKADPVEPTDVDGNNSL